jgi:signal peptide peptidase SppA
MNKQLHISISSLLQSPWAVRQDYLAGMFVKLTHKAEKDGELIVEHKEDVVYEIVNGKAIIDVDGIFYNKCILDNDYGYVKLDLEKTLIAAVDDSSVEEVILKVKSPGGVSYGVDEIHDLILSLREIKPIIGYVNGLACSAAYWILSACTQIYAYKQNDVGSIGVYCMVVDYSKFLETAGIKVQYIKAGKFKTTGNAYEELSADGRKYLQEGVDECYMDFKNAVSTSRGLKLEESDTWAEGIVFEAKNALKLGLIDGIKTWQEVLGYDKKTFSLSNWRSLMAIGEPKISALTAEQFKTMNEGLYNSILAEGKTLGEKPDEQLVKENAELKAENQLYKDKEQKEVNDKKIMDFATSLNLKDKGEALVKENKSVTEAFELLANEASKVNADKQAQFLASSAAPAGASSDTAADSAPKTDVEAMTHCRTKYGLGKREAWQKARIEFASLFGTESREETNEQ